ncbi:MAG: DUF4839 domain-containing protein [Clostridia bacterium]|nr:DUF4839 domain-containing protein [Clostridia bacterium]
MKKRNLIFLTFVFLLCLSIAPLSACHKCEFERRVLSSALCKGATCTESPLYYLSCSCGALSSETFSSGVSLGHNWEPANCSNPKTCNRCGETTGNASPSAHDWLSPTCLLATTCKHCGTTTGSALGHNFVDATCTTPKTCDRCGYFVGSALGHTWVDATYTTPKTCTTCNTTTGTKIMLYAPLSAEDCKFKNYQLITTQFKNAGFVNIEYEIIYDIVTGFLWDEGEVGSVVLNGLDTFSNGDAFSYDTIVTITYHDLWSNEPSEEEKEVIDSNGTYAPISSANAKGLNFLDVGAQFEDAGFTEVFVEQVVDYDTTLELGDVLYVELNGTKDYKTNLKYSKSVEIVIYYYIGPLTVENNGDTETLVNLKDPNDNFVALYAEAYDGLHLEIDACIWAIWKSDGYNTRYDVLLGCKDFDENHAYGPNITLNCEYLGSDYFKVGDNVRIVVTIDYYDSYSGLFYVDLVKISHR